MNKIKIALFFTLLLTISCSRLYYYPKKPYYTDPKKHFSKDYELINVTTSDRVEITGWFFKGNGKNLVVQFHGNAENMSTHYISLLWLTDFNNDLIVFDYRGYGKSSGEPSPKGLRQDGLSILDYAYSMYQKGSYDKLIVFSQSIGGAVAMDAVAHWKHKNKIDLLVLESTFSSYSRMGSNILQRSWITYLFSPLAYILLDTSTNPSKVLNKLTMNKLVIHGTKDSTIPIKEGNKLFSDLPEPKSIHEIKGGGHVDAFFVNAQKYRQDFLRFVEGI